MNLLNFFNRKLNNPSPQPSPSRGEGAGFRRGSSCSEAPKMLGVELAKRERLDLNMILGYLPDPDDILKNTGKDISAYRKLMTDSQVRACVNSRKAGVMSLNWEISVGKGRHLNPSSGFQPPSPSRGEGCDAGRHKGLPLQVIKTLYDNLDIDAVNHAILNAPFFGFQPIEVIWEQVGEYILPSALVPKNPEWFLFDSDGNLRLSTVGNVLQGELLPEKKFLLPTYNDINNKSYNPYGDRILSSCFWPATFKKSGFKWWVTFAEKYGMPYIVGKLPRSVMDSERENMKNQLGAMVMDAVAVISDDAQLDFVESGNRGGSADLYERLVNACDAAISKAILGQTLTTDSGNGSGSFALGKVHADVRYDIVQADRRIVERTHNQLIRWICEINFGSFIDGEIPKFSMFGAEDVNKDLAERDEILVKQGVKFNKSYYIENYGLDEGNFTI